MDHEGAIAHILKRLEKDLPEHLLYHGHHHTMDVLEATERIAQDQGVSESDLHLLLVAAAYHDCGFLYGHEDHEEKGTEIAREALSKFGFGQPEIDQICIMIIATQVPQRPTDKLAYILCDADLDYLGRDDFEPIADSLFKELQHLNIVTDIKVWNRIQVGFLSDHIYHTSYGKKHRQPKKEMHLEKIRSIVSGYDS